MRKTLAILVLPLLALASCGGNTPTPAQTIFAASSTLSGAELAASTYEALPNANPAIVAKIKQLDGTAYGIVNPLVTGAASGQNVVTLAEAQAAQAAVQALTAYELQNGVK